MMQHHGRTTRKKTRRYVNRSGSRGKKTLLLSLGMVLCGVVLVVALVNLIGYGRDYVNSQRAAEDMRELYYATGPEAPLPTDAPTPVPESTPGPAATPVPTAKPLILESRHYPNNPSARVQEKFLALRLNNQDVVAWLKIGTQLDEAVVQRDN